MATALKKEKAAGVESTRRRSPALDSWKRMLKRPMAVLSMAFIVFILLIVIFADVIVSYDAAIMQDGTAQYEAPSSEHIFGTDNYGRDLFARVIHGTRTDMLMSVLATTVSVGLGIILACLCAYYGGKADLIIMRIADVFSSIPPLVLALAICAGIGRGMWQLIVALIVGTIPLHTRMLRSKSLSVANMEYVESAQVLGAGTYKIIRRHYVPNISSFIIIQFTQNVSINIIVGATLSFVGLGVKAPTPEWGMLLSEGLDYLRICPWMAIFPGIFIVLTALSVSTFGDCLRDAFDPALKGKA